MDPTFKQTFSCRRQNGHSSGPVTFWANRVRRTALPPPSSGPLTFQRSWQESGKLGQLGPNSGKPATMPLLGPLSHPGGETVCTYPAVNHPIECSIRALASQSLRAMKQVEAVDDQRSGLVPCLLQVRGPAECPQTGFYALRSNVLASMPRTASERRPAGGACTTPRHLPGTVSPARPHDKLLG